MVRQTDAEGKSVRDILSLASETLEGKPLILTFMQGGRRTRPPESLQVIRNRAAGQIRMLPEHLRRLKEDPPYTVEISEELKALAQSLGKE